MVLSGENKAREDLFDASLDTKLAPSLGGVVLGKEHEIYTNPSEFFKRTLVTEQLLGVLENIIDVVKGEGGKKILVLTAYFGGGKTHTLVTIYHALSSPRSLLLAVPEKVEYYDKVRRIVEELSEVVRGDSINVIVIDGFYSALAPSPSSPLEVGAYCVKTLWGYVAHALGMYAMMKDKDVTLTPPEVDKLLELFRGKKVVILIDEIAEYIKRLVLSGDENLRRYAYAIESFIASLVNAVELSHNVILIISLPAERNENRVLVEPAYDVIRRTIENLFRIVHRQTTHYVSPIAPRDIPALLRVRLFEKIDREKAKEVYEYLSIVYKDNEHIFGPGYRDIINRILDTYPFHPKYVETLLEILDKHEGLQRTRDLVRISRIVLREIVLRSNEVFDLIAPWHIDVTEECIKELLLKGIYESFKQVVDTDIKERTRKADNPWLAKITALSIFVKTFVYGGVLHPKSLPFPNEKELSLMVYEPASFRARGIYPKDITDTIRWINENLIYVVRDETTGRLWFTIYVTPIKYVEERARYVDDNKAWEIVHEYIRELLVKSREDVQRRKSKKILPRVFDAQRSVVSRSCEPIDYDEKAYIVYTCIDIPEEDRSSDREKKLLEVIYSKRNGERIYKNTVYVLSPSKVEKVRIVLDTAKKVIACNEVERELDKYIPASSSSEEYSMIKRVMGEKLNNYRNTILQNLLTYIVTMLDKVAYPFFDETSRRNIVREVRLIPAEALLVSVEKALSDIGVDKVKFDIDFDTLEYLLRCIGVDIVNGDRERFISDIIDYFYSNPILPAVPKNKIIEALSEGLEKLDIGLRCGDRVYYKRIYEGSIESFKDVPEVAEGEKLLPDKIHDDCMVLPWKIALIEQMKKLKKHEIVVGGLRKIIEYYIKINDDLIPIDAVLEDIEKFDMEILKTAPIVKTVRTALVKLELEKTFIETSPEENIHIKVFVSRMGPFIGDVELSVSMGKLDKTKLSINDNFSEERLIWEIKAPSEPGEYVTTIEVRDCENRVLDSSRVVIRVRSLESEKRIRGVPPPGSKVKEIVLRIDKLYLKPLQILTKFGKDVVVSNGKFSLELEGLVGKGKSNVVINVENVYIDDFLAVIRSLVTRYPVMNINSHIELVLRPRDGTFLTTPSFSEVEKRELEQFLEYVLYE
ncbi:MAG: DUF499 domain-containing protein [Crenarchaeota archaeon]|nr:DUF499 domain-containing protein [Thermoproteota archaeon]